MAALDMPEPCKTPPAQLERVPLRSQTPFGNEFSRNSVSFYERRGDKGAKRSFAVARSQTGVFGNERKDNDMPARKPGTDLGGVLRRATNPLSDNRNKKRLFAFNVSRLAQPA